MTRAALTGAGARCALGDDLDEVARALREGTPGIARVTRFSTEGYRAHVAAELRSPAWAQRVRDLALGAHLVNDPIDELCVSAAREALTRAGLHAPGAFDPRRAGVAVGTTAGGLASRAELEFAARSAPHERARWLALYDQGSFASAAAAVARALGLRGPRLTASTACASSAHAVLHALQWIEAGTVDVVLVGGGDVLVEALFAGFYALGAMSEGPCAPFAERDGEKPGMTLGEGAGFLVLEREAHARARGFEATHFVTGAGSSMDAHHATAADPAGHGVAIAVRSALAHAGIAPDALDYVNAHGTGTTANDSAEPRGLRRALGQRADEIPTSSTKGHLGHTLGAAGALELIATYLCMREGTVPPTRNAHRARAGAPRDPVFGETPRAHATRAALSLNAAFGGMNTAVLLEDARSVAGRASPEVTPARTVYLVAAHTLSAHGLDGLGAALDEGLLRASREPPHRDGLARATHCARLPAPDLRREAPHADPRELDRASAAALYVVARALRADGGPSRGEARKRDGLFYATEGVSPDTGRALWDSVRERGYAKMSAPAFSRSVVNAPPGAVSRALSLQGPSGVLAGPTGSALAALVLASEHLARRDDAERITVAAVCTLGDDELFEHARYEAQRYEPDARFGVDPYGARGRVLLGEIAAAFVLRTGHARQVAVLGWGWHEEGEAGLARAVTDALARAGRSAGEVGAVYASGDGDSARAGVERDALSRVFSQAQCAVPHTVHAAVSTGCVRVADAAPLALAYEALTRGSAHPSADGARATGALGAVLVTATHALTGSLAVLLGVPA